MTAPTIPVAHIDDPGPLATLLDALRALHGPTYQFAMGRWAGDVQMIAPPRAVLYRFLIEAHDAMVSLKAGDSVRGPDPADAYQLVEGQLAKVTTDHWAALWAGDVVTAGDQQSVRLHGAGVYFEVTVEATGYDAPRAAFLRNLVDHPGGCAAYPGAFRREAMPPQRPAPDDVDQRGVNRINEHTLDMRIDRRPPPIRHYHGPIAVGEGQVVNHSEIAIVLPRALYGLPEVDQVDQGHVIIYRQPASDPTDTIKMGVRPGSIVVTPATAEGTAGHCFENCFAMLIAIPGFVAPYHMLA